MYMAKGNITLIRLPSMGELCQGPQGLVTDLVGQLLSMQEAEDSLESWITNGTLPQQGHLECVRSYAVGIYLLQA